ncbi:intermediate conductance calcium-activated potassium channel protein 4 isoform X1 [Ascaphus truei]|uniref:intermediate conductance calcium-activated potassium channel protein 4 isoform X1 n=1 Tax=Ascaphus truei TaxID=8439 RepID=UPI003F594175
MGRPACRCLQHAFLRPGGAQRPRGDMQTKELCDISILTSQPQAGAGRERPGENLRKLRKRQALVLRKKKLSAWALLLALLGIFLMVLHTELLWFGTCQLFMNDNSLWDWRIAVNAKKLAWIFLEIVICAVHPFPSARQCEGEQELERASQDLPFLSEADILLSTLMFLRVYLLPRTVLLHSRVLVDASYRSIGSLNKIKFQYQFVMKILMNTYPARVLLILTIGLWIISSWVLSVCEREKGQATGNLASTMWLIPITFLTIGYGDVVPHTVCGRMVCLCTGVMGVGCTALIVAVAAQKLEFTKAEKHVHNFMMDIHYMKQVKCAAANVLGEAWLLYRHTKGGDSAKIRQHQRNLLGAIHIFRHRRRKHKTLQDQVNAMVDISKMQMLMYDMDLNLNSSHRDLEKRIDQLDKKLDEISRLIMTAIESPRQ